MRALLAVVVAVVLSVLAPVAATAAEYPPYEGGSFPVIHGPTDPEEFTWEVQLDEEQTLELIDDQHAAVRYEDGPTAFTISAAPAHDATGDAVPTTLAVSEGNLLTLTVHHRAGNPAADRAPFVYPIAEGPAYDTGYATAIITMPPSEPRPVAPSAPRCEVPDLAGRSLKASRKLLRRSNCKLGPVRGERSKAAKVVKQYRKPGKSLAAGAEVGVKLG